MTPLRRPMTRFPTRAHQTFAPEARSVGQARRFARLTLEEWGADDLVDSCVADRQRARDQRCGPYRYDRPADVGAAGPGAAHRGGGPASRAGAPDREPPAADTSEHGRGLVITTSLSSDWGVEYTSATKRVWALCKRDGSSPTAASQVDVMVSTDGVHVAVVLISSAGDVTVWNDDATALFGWAGGRGGREALLRRGRSRPRSTARPISR